MKASELISELQKAVSSYGDLEILIRDCEDGADYEGCTVHADPASEAERSAGIRGTIDINVWNGEHGGSTSRRGITVGLPYGELVATVGGDDKAYPEIFTFLRRPDGVEIDLVAVSCDAQNERDVLKAFLWSDVNSDSYEKSYEWNIEEFRKIEV